MYVTDPPNLYSVISNDVCRHTNLLYNSADTKQLFTSVNNKLNKINEWFVANKLSLTAKKAKYTFIHKYNKKNDIPLAIPKLEINEKVIVRTVSIKFLGILLDEYLLWNDHTSDFSGQGIFLGIRALR